MEKRGATRKKLFCPHRQSPRVGPFEKPPVLSAEDVGQTPAAGSRVWDRPMTEFTGCMYRSEFEGFENIALPA